MAKLRVLWRLLRRVEVGIASQHACDPSLEGSFEKIVELVVCAAREASSLVASELVTRSARILSLDTDDPSGVSVDCDSQVLRGRPIRSVRRGRLSLLAT